MAVVVVLKVMVMVMSGGGGGCMHVKLFQAFPTRQNVDYPLYYCELWTLTVYSTSIK